MQSPQHRQDKLRRLAGRWASPRWRRAAEQEGTAAFAHRRGSISMKSFAIALCTSLHNTRGSLCGCTRVCHSPRSCRRPVKCVAGQAKLFGSIYRLSDNVAYVTLVFFS